MPTNLPKTAVIAGVGEGMGLALSKRFAAGGYSVVMLARNEEKFAGYEKMIHDQGGKAVGMKLDTRNEQEIVSVLDRVEKDVGPIEVAIYNAGAQHRKALLEITADAFEKVWRLACLGGFVFGREAIRRMLLRKSGTVLFTGATSSLRGGPNFAAFASAKFGLRAVAQSMAREFGPQGIHVASVFIDGAIDMPAIHKMFPDMVKNMPPNGLLSPDAVAETYFQVHRQHPSAWTHEADIRPFCEKF
jgi:NAD(P)-dependent dehydrogenase (short-subunit alcohol dehydrogenase family)